MKKICITVSEEMFRHIEECGRLFPWMVKTAPDYGPMIEHLTGWKLENLIEGEGDELIDEIENIDFESKEEAEGMVSRFMAKLPDRAEFRVRQNDDHWNIMGFFPGSWEPVLFDFCEKHGLDYDRCASEVASITVGCPTEQGPLLEAYFAMVLKRTELEKLQREVVA